MDTVDKLWAIEEIKQLKARYFRFVDTKQNEGLYDTLSEDIEWAWHDPDTGEPVLTMSGKDQFRQYMETMKASQLAGFTVHHGHMPEIEILSESSATGIWAMVDYVDLPGSLQFIGYGHYHEVYTKGDDGKWRISKATLTRLHVDQLARSESATSWSGGRFWTQGEGPAARSVT